VNGSDGIAALGANKNVDKKRKRKKKKKRNLCTEMLLMRHANNANNVVISYNGDTRFSVYSCQSEHTMFWSLSVWERADSVFRRRF